MTVARTVAQQRQQRAEVLFGAFHQWIPVTTRFASTARGGSVAFAIPSQTRFGLYHVANLERCGCWDSIRRSGPCKHRRAVRLALRHFGLDPAVQPTISPTSHSDKEHVNGFAF